MATKPVIPPPSGYPLFTPVIDTFLKEHLFADIFARDNLDYQSRELATIAALASMTGTAGQLRFHLGAAMNSRECRCNIKSGVKHQSTRRLWTARAITGTTQPLVPAPMLVNPAG